jgi:8-oxo-dGTP diphosphatase
MKRIRVTAAVIRRDGAVLLARRSESQTRPLLWEFPGGKVEPGESDRDCLVRELHEELGIDTSVEELIGVYAHAYPDIHIDLAVYEVELLKGDPHPNEHRELAWAAADTLADYDLAAADIPAARLLAESARKEL